MATLKVGLPGLLPAIEFQALRGLGVSAQIGEPLRQRVLVGSRKFLQVMDNTPLANQALKNATRGETVVWLGWGRYFGRIYCLA